MGSTRAARGGRMFEAVKRLWTSRRAPAPQGRDRGANGSTRPAAIGRGRDASRSAGGAPRRTARTHRRARGDRRGDENRPKGAPRARGGGRASPAGGRAEGGGGRH